jgi:hypothetical protein
MVVKKDNEYAMSPHKAEACKQLSPLGRRLFKYVEFDEDETILAEVHKHPIGVIGIWLTGGFITAAILIVAIMTLSSSLLSSLGLNLSSTAMGGIIIAIVAVLVISMFVGTVIAAFIYKSSTIFVTSDKISEVVYKSIFNRVVTQSGIGNIQDVTVTQKGVLPRLFHYGNLLIETAGETVSPQFTYVPHPHSISRTVIQAHEDYVENELKR